MQQRERRVKMLKILFDVCLFTISVVTVGQASIVRHVVAIDEPPFMSNGIGGI